MCKRAVILLQMTENKRECMGWRDIGCCKHNSAHGHFTPARLQLVLLAMNHAEETQGSETLTCLQVCKYVDIPLQHICNLTLLAMNRPPRAHTEALLRKLRARIPGLALRTTFISGFPGAKEAQAAAKDCAI